MIEKQVYIKLVKNFLNNKNVNSLIRMYVDKSAKERIFRNGLIEAFFEIEMDNTISDKDKEFLKKIRFEISLQLMDILTPTLTNKQ